MKLKVAFVCTGNSCRSQIAEGFARHYGSDVLEIYSAGTHPSSEVNTNAVAVMKEVGVDISSQYPKTLDDIPEELDILITMGCGVVCPFIPNKYEEDWGLEDPVGKSMDTFRQVRDTAEKKIKELVEKVKKGDL